MIPTSLTPDATVSATANVACVRHSHGANVDPPQDDLTVPAPSVGSETGQAEK